MLKKVFLILILAALLISPVPAANWTLPSGTGDVSTVDVVNSTYMSNWLFYLTQSNSIGTPGERVNEGGFEGGWGTWTTNGGVVAVREGTATGQPVHDGAWAVRLETTGYAEQQVDLSGVQYINVWVNESNVDLYMNGVYKNTLSGSTGTWTRNIIDLRNTSTPYSGVYTIKILNNGATAARIDDISADAEVFGVWEFPVIGFASSIMGPFTDAFNGFSDGNAVYLILWGVFFMMVWRQSGKITIPALMAVITAGAFSLLIPTWSQPWCSILLCAAIASQLFTFFAKE